MTKFLAIAFLAVAAARLRAESGSEVIVIYNTRVPESKSVADHYAEVRHVPAEQIFGFALSTTEEMPRGEFQDALQKPLAKALEQKKLWHMVSETVSGTNGHSIEVRRVKTSSIRYAVLCYGVPLHITEDPTLKEKFEDQRPEMRRNEAAVDSELALLPCVEQHLPLMGPLPNVLYAATNSAVFDPTNGLLMVARLDGPTAAIARGLVDKAIQAETDGLWGRAYFDLRGLANPGYKLGDDWLRSAAEICRHLGFETVTDDKPSTFQPEFPMSQIAIYCGWYDEHVSGPFTRTNVEFMPGAFAYHLHSFSAVPFRGTTNRWAGPLVSKGATCTMGCVAEPFLMGTPDIAVFCGRLVLLGFSFGEAAYASQGMLSWQTVVVGDPLYRPFAKAPQRLHEELEQRHSKYLEWSYLRLMNLNLANGKRANEVSDFLEQLPLTRQSAVLTEKLADLYAAQGKPNSAVEAYDKALQLDASPQQRVRLRFALADKLAALNRPNDVYTDLHQLLAENPDYPDKFNILKKLLDLAIASNDKEKITASVKGMQEYGVEANRKAAEDAKAHGEPN